MKILYHGESDSSGLTGIAVDTGSQTIYWCDEIGEDEKGLWQAKLDGSGATWIYESPKGWNAGMFTLVTL